MFLYQTIKFTNGQRIAVVNGMGGQDYHTRYVYGPSAFQIWNNGELKQYISDGAVSKDTVWESTSTSSQGRYRALNTVSGRYVFDRITTSPYGVLFLVFSYSAGEGPPVIVNTNRIATARPFRGYPPVTINRDLFEESIAQEPDQPVLFFDPIDGHAEWWTGNSPGNMSFLGDRFDTSQTDFTWIPTDPYTPGGESDLAGGEGDFDNTSFPIDFPDLPTLSAVDTGLISLFNPYVAELKTLANFMWGQMFDLDNWKKLFANPMDALLGLSIVPVHVPNGGSDTVKVGNIDTGVSMTKAASQYVEVDCGTLNLNEYWGAYLDYEPYTHVQVYLPYIGTKEISTDDVMGKPVHIKYHVDILSGACVAYIKCGQSVMYSFNGQCSASIPITGRDWTNVVNGVISLVSSTMGMIAMGQAAGALGSAAGLAKSATSQARLAAGAAQMQSGMIQGGSNIAATAIDITKPIIQKSGAVSSTSGLLGVQTPYMILTRPRQCLPSNQNKYIGYPSLVTRTLGDCEGFTRVEAIHLENIGATDAEIEEIESILHSGVIF